MYDPHNWALLSFSLIYTTDIICYLWIWSPPPPEKEGNGLLMMMMMHWWPTLESNIWAVMSMSEVEWSGCSTTHCSNTSCACFVFPCLPNNAASTTFASKAKWVKSCFNASKSVWHTSSWGFTNLLVNKLKRPLSHISIHSQHTPQNHICMPVDDENHMFTAPYNYVP